MRKILLLAITAIFSLNLFCQVHWTKHPDNPVLTAGASGEWDDRDINFGSVIYYDNAYHMWYTAGLNFRIGYATSPNGITWTKDSNNPVLDQGQDGDWDGKGIFGGPVVVIDSIFHMWYIGHSSTISNRDFRIGHATSPDGATWTKDTLNNPVLDMGPDGTWDANWVSVGSVLFNGSEYHMWYFAWGGSGTTVRIGHATSPDGVTWMKDPSNPVMIADTSWEYPRMDSPVVIFDGTTYHMWYSGGGWYTWQTGYATSDDGSVWTKYANNPVLGKGITGSWDDRFASVASVIDSSGVKYKMWYGGGQTEPNGSIGYAESDARLPCLWVKSKTVVDTIDIDTLVAEIHKDGIIYIVPDGTSPVNDSIDKYKLASVDALASTEVYIPLTDIALGQYSVIAVSNMEFVSPNPVLLMVVADAAPPVLVLAEDTVDIGDSIMATSDKDGMLYLVFKGTPPDLAKESYYVKDSLTAYADVQIKISTSGLTENLSYWLYAANIYGYISEPVTVTIEPKSGTGVIKNSDAGIRIYPNPANDLLTIVTDNPKLRSIEITSLNGKQIFSTQMEGTSHQIDLSSFQKGVYLITIRSEDFITTEKIIKL